MRKLLESATHLVRMAGLFAAGVGVFVILRSVLIPKDFGLYGHYRPGALADAAARPMAFAGHANCADCHQDIVDSQKGSKHAAVSCEACHGALAKHAGDPSAQTPEKKSAATLCMVCHAPNIAKPKKFPQVDPKTHGEGNPCTSCHGPHAPEKGPTK
jgi:hypothetical protein